MNNTILTDEKCELNNFISTAEIKQDIKDTQIEIEYHQKQIDDRKVFIDKLNCILDYRKRNTIVS